MWWLTSAALGGALLLLWRLQTAARKNHFRRFASRERVDVRRLIRDLGPHEADIVDVERAWRTVAYVLAVDAEQLRADDPLKDFVSPFERRIGLENAVDDLEAEIASMAPRGFSAHLYTVRDAVLVIARLYAQERQ